MSELPRPLSLTQRRILGVLIEKAKTTPDGYPLSVNALVTGSNQKSNRDPVLELEDSDVQETLEELQGGGMVEPVFGGRVERWRHTLTDSWKLSKLESAVLAELFLRGAQTEGELRGRAARMNPIASVDELREILTPLKERGFIVYLTPEGKRGTALTHGFYERSELDSIKAQWAGMGDGPARPAAPRAAGEVAQLREEVTELRAEVAQLREEVARLKQAGI